MKNGADQFNDSPESFDLEEIELKIWEYIDGEGTAEERSEVERLLVEHANWRAKYKELLDMHQALASTDLEQPSLRFTRNVMEEIARLQISPAAKQYINKKVIWGIAAFFLTVIAGFLGYAISLAGWSATGTESSWVGKNLVEIDYSRVFSNSWVNVFVMMNILLGLMLLDRFLAQRKKQWHQV